jgi:hypothetical protein
MFHVFISYSRIDRDRAKRVAEALRERGYPVWWDDDIAAGQTFDAAIEQALADATCVVVLWSSASVKSDWVKTEAAEAARRKILVPVLLDEVAIPLEFRRLQTANLAQWSGRADSAEFDRVLRAIDLATRRDSGSQPASPGGDGAKSRPDVAATTGAADVRSFNRVTSESPGAGSQLSTSRTGRRNIPALAFVSIVLILVIAGSAFWLKSRTPTVVSQDVRIPTVVSQDVQIPNVVGMSYDVAAATLAGLRLIPDRQERPSSSGQAGTILSQTPAAGVMQPPMTKVVLAVAAPVPFPPPPGIASRNAETRAAGPPPKAVAETRKPEGSRYDRATEEELQNRLELAKARGQTSVDFFDRRRRTVESAGGHLRPEIDSAIQEFSIGVRSATNFLQEHQVTEARGQIDTLEKTLQRLETMK